MKKYIIANWKANPTSEADALALAQAVAGIPHGEHVEVVICPPFVYLEPIAKKLLTFNLQLITKLGVQDDSSESSGPYTGEVSPAMLKDLGVEYVILGHSERRARGETDDIIAKKVEATLVAGLTPILCVGEPLPIREQGIEMAKKFVEHQLVSDLQLITDNIQHKTIFIAYEPVWAISTNPGAKPDNPENAAEMVTYIKNFLTSNFELRTSNILYGGSTNPENAAGFLTQPSIDGLLVGGASLKPDEFRTIVQSASSIT